MRGKQIIEEIDFLKSQAQDQGRILAALQNADVKPASLKILLRRREREDLLAFLFPPKPNQHAVREHGEMSRYEAGCRCLLCREANNERAARLRKARTAEAKDPNDPRHGKASFYTNHGCRCERCREAQRAKVSADYQRRLATPLEPNDKRHGTLTFYTAHGCRCDRCKDAARIRDARRKKK
jgi:hypothetical protein